MSAYVIAKKDREFVDTPVFRAGEDGKQEAVLVFSSMEKIRPALEAYVEEVKLNNCKLCDEPTVGELCRACEMLEDLQVI